MSARILVVEDEYFIAQEIAEALESAGYRVVGPCPKVADALAILAGADPCDAAVLDASLRGASSLPVCEALGERGIPFVVVTGFSPDQLPPPMAAATVLAKPLDPEALASALRAAMAGE
ncbi:response regulator [Erythrobacter sp. CCH5-A1]|jgi:CheY-like chemotaxis protein|uniref:response regulator n=1 Tax=Erythrobacter sp. CCH5-A1 TaxID=1768792 RepID=UPI00082A4D13|nr:response regulator [Erythrobacter sp. CCH5-A1]